LEYNLFGADFKGSYGVYIWLIAVNHHTALVSHPIKYIFPPYSVEEEYATQVGIAVLDVHEFHEMS